MPQGSVLPEGPPHAGLLGHAEPLVEPGFRFGVRPRFGGVLEDLGHEGVGVGTRQAGPGEATVAEASRAQGPLHRLVEGRVVGDVHRVQGDPHQLTLHDRVVGERAVEVGRVEASQPIPQREVGRRWFLRLQRDHAMDGLDDTEQFATEQHLTAQRRAVELPRSEPHSRTCTERIYRLATTADPSDDEACSWPGESRNGEAVGPRRFACDPGRWTRIVVVRRGWPPA